MIEKLFSFNYNEVLKSRLLELGETTPQIMHLLFENWHPKLEANFDHYLSLIKRPENIETMQKIKDTWLAPGFKERCLAAYPKLDAENTVICHCDAQENNVLLMRDCLTEIKLIDYEYTAFGP